MVPQNFADPSAQLATLTGNQIIASAAGTAPEPATWALMLLGFAGFRLRWLSSEPKARSFQSEQALSEFQGHEGFAEPS